MTTYNEIFASAEAVIYSGQPAVNPYQPQTQEYEVFRVGLEAASVLRESWEIQSYREQHDRNCNNGRL